KQLARAGLLISYRGAKGGYGLARPPEDISVAEIVAAIEGPISLTHCVDTGPVACEYRDGCVVSSNWNRINQVVQNALQGISLKDMIQPLNPVPQEAFVPLSTLKNLGA